MDRTGQHSVAAYLVVLRRRIWIVLLAAAIAPAVAVYLARSQPSVFSASTDVLLTSSATGAQSPLGSDESTLLATQQQIAASPRVGQLVVRSTGIQSRTPAQVTSEASISPVGGADVLRISITDSDPELAVRLANAYARQYARYKRTLDSSFLNSTRDELEARMAALKRAGQEQSAIYATLASQDRALQQNAALQTVSAVILRPATGAATIRPKPTRYGILGLGIGLVLGFALALLAESLDPRIRSTHDIAEVIGLPVLGRLPAPRRRLRRRHRLTMLTDPAGRDANAMRILGTNLDFANIRRGARLVMITSPTEGEGKSTTAANLAVALARAGRDVLLVDLDLHRPVIAKFFDIVGNPGVTGVASGRVALDDAIVRVPVALSGEGSPFSGVRQPDGLAVLKVLPAGPALSNPGEFMSTQAVPRLLSALRPHAEIVVIDAPPLLEVSDTLSLSGSVEGVILVTRLRMAKRTILRQTRQILEATPSAKLGVVVTGIEHEKGYWYEGYGSYYYGPRGPGDGHVDGEHEHAGSAYR